MPGLAQAQAAGKSRYGLRRFASVPGREEAHRLLADLQNGSCAAMPIYPQVPVTLYGGGDMGRMARSYYQTLGYDVARLLDRDAQTLRNDPFWAGIEILHPDDVPARMRQETQLILCIATIPFKQVEAALIAEGWSDIVPFYDVAESQRDRHPLSNGWFATTLDARDFRQTAAVLASWGDDISRAHHIQFLAWRVLRQEWVFDHAPVTGHDRFFIPEIIARAGRLRLCIDAGAHLGQVTRKLAALNATSHIIAIEPDAGHRKAMEVMLTDIERRVTVLPVALADVPGERIFHAGIGYASQLSPTGQDTVRVVTLDSLGFAPDYVKLHLEGTELPALKGARATLLRHRPILAVTTYHNADGIWKTPAWLMEHLPGYRFLFRTHSWCGTGAVVYALPEEKA